MTVVINNDGTITVTPTPQEQGLAQMILADGGPNLFREVFQLQFDNKTKEIISSRFASLPPETQAQVLALIATPAP